MSVAGSLSDKARDGYWASSYSKRKQKEKKNKMRNKKLEENVKFI